MEVSSSSSVSQVMFAQQVSVAVQKLAMESIEQNTDAMRQMMERSLTPHLGGGIDLKG